MKFLVLLLVLLVAVAWLAIGRRRDRSDESPPPPAQPPPAPPARPATMLACAHCGVHLPGSEALRDAEGRAYCGDAHRLAGPRRH
jgi:uncharacterized protein